MLLLLSGFLLLCFQIGYCYMLYHTMFPKWGTAAIAGIIVSLWNLAVIWSRTGGTKTKILCTLLSLLILFLSGLLGYYYYFQYDPTQCKQYTLWLSIACGAQLLGIFLLALDTSDTSNSTTKGIQRVAGDEDQANLVYQRQVDRELQDKIQQKQHELSQLKQKASAIEDDIQSLNDSRTSNKSRSRSSSRVV